MKSNISLVGKVNIYYRSAASNKRTFFCKRHNTVTARLARGIANYLANVFTNDPKLSLDYLPNYLGIGEYESESASDLGASESVVNQFTLIDLVSPILNTDNSPIRLELTSKQVDTSSSNSNISMTMTCYIPPALLNPGTIIRELGLFSDKNNKTLLSRIHLPDANKIEVRSGYGIDIVWNLIISAGESVARTGTEEE